MRFANRGESLKIRIGELNEDFYWITLKKGETMELPRKTGKRNKLEEVTNRIQNVTESKIGPVKVETKQLEPEYVPDDSFFEELKSIKGIGKKTAEDIVDWGTKEKLLEKIKSKEHLPFRDDVEKLLEEKYG